MTDIKDIAKQEQSQLNLRVRMALPIKVNGRDLVFDSYFVMNLSTYDIEDDLLKLSEKEYVFTLLCPAWSDKFIHAGLDDMANLNGALGKLRYDFLEICRILKPIKGYNEISISIEYINQFGSVVLRKSTGDTKWFCDIKLKTDEACDLVKFTNCSVDLQTMADKIKKFLDKKGK